MGLGLDSQLVIEFIINQIYNENKTGEIPPKFKKIYIKRVVKKSLTYDEAIQEFKEVYKSIEQAELFTPKLNEILTEWDLKS